IRKISRPVRKYSFTSGSSNLPTGMAVSLCARSARCWLTPTAARVGGGETGSGADPVLGRPQSDIPIGSFCCLIGLRSDFDCINPQLVVLRVASVDAHERGLLVDGPAIELRRVSRGDGNAMVGCPTGHRARLASPCVGASS